MDTQSKPKSSTKDSVVSEIKSAVASGCDATIKAVSDAVCNTVANTSFVSTVENTVGGYFKRTTEITTPLSVITSDGDIAAVVSKLKGGGIFGAGLTAYGINIDISKYKGSKGKWRAVVDGVFGATVFALGAFEVVETGPLIIGRIVVGLVLDRVKDKFF